MIWLGRVSKESLGGKGRGEGEREAPRSSGGGGLYRPETESDRERHKRRGPRGGRYELRELRCRQWKETGTYLPNGTLLVPWAWLGLAWLEEEPEQRARFLSCILTTATPHTSRPAPIAHPRHAPATDPEEERGRFKYLV